jgi:probable aminopeptidase NPEPL1
LTGSQLVATGKKHAGILASSEALEKRAVEAGMYSGDLCFPLLYAPELLMDEFKSEVADMRNSVKDRSNAQTSCAGHFIEAHLKEGYQGGWLHVDMAGPGTLGQRGTGYGVGLVLSLLEAPGF